MAKKERLEKPLCIGYPWEESGHLDQIDPGRVAILARDWVGLNYLGEVNKEKKTAEIYPGRVAGAKVILPGGRPIAVYSVYLRVGEKLSVANREVLARLAGHIQSHDLEWLVGGDFNMDPSELETAAFTAKLGGRVNHPPLLRA